MPTAFLPEEDQGYVIANIELPAGSTANRTIETISAVENYFKEQPQVENIIAVQGFSNNGSGKAMGQLLFGLPDSMVIAIVPPAISALGNSSGIDMRLEDRSGMGHDALMAAADQLLSLAKQSPVFDPQSVRITGLGPGKQIRLEIDREKAAALGVNFNEASALIAGSLGSSFVGKFH
uniref:Uncharacterized protein n=1 Tax=Panagrolaimus superbus TaxID=310955 RepID=A0A914YSK3_9BILA